MALRYSQLVQIPVLPIPGRPAPLYLLALLLVVASTPQSTTATEARTEITREYHQHSEQSRFDELLALYGQHKQLPAGFELQTLVALSHYPELRDVKIRFIVDDVSIPLSSRPYWASMLRSATKRTYLVIIDNAMNGDRDALLLQNQPFNAQVGVIGHELAHTMYYLDRSFFGIVADALCQLNGCRIEFERATDQRLVEYGLGWQRYDHSLFLRNRFAGDISEASTLEGGGGAYMSPAEILSLIENNPTYAD